MVLVVANINAWEWLGQETPSWWAWLTGNKIYACMMLFFLGNAIEGQLVSTGAFEISFNGKYRGVSCYTHSAIVQMNMLLHTYHFLVYLSAACDCHCCSFLNIYTVT